MSFQPLSPASGSFQGLRLRRGISGWEQDSMSSGRSVRENGSAGTWVMWLLSQMMRDREMERSCPLWVLVNTPFLSHQNLSRKTFTFISLAKGKLECF